MSTTAPPGRQLTLDDALAAAAQDTPTVRDDRVVPVRETCSECASRPAGANGLCPGCQLDHSGDVCGGGRAL